MNAACKGNHHVTSEGTYSYAAQICATSNCKKSYEGAKSPGYLREIMVTSLPVTSKHQADYNDRILNVEWASLSPLNFPVPCQFVPRVQKGIVAVANDEI